MKILSMKARNVKRLRAVEITPQGAVVIVSGRNGQGKSSVLDSIAYLLGGKEAICSEPVRRGEQDAEVTCDLGEFVVRRTFTAGGGGQLVVETKDGARFSSPQGKLNELVGRLSFDPLEFSRMDLARQAETLRSLVGLDFRPFDGERLGVFDQRTDVNREVKSLKARLEAMPALHDETGQEEIASVELVRELENAQAVNQANAGVRAQVGVAQAGIGVAERHLTNASLIVQDIVDQIEALLARRDREQAQVQASKRELELARQNVHNATQLADAVVDVDLQPIKDRLAGLEVTNQKVRENRLRQELEAKLEREQFLSRGLTDRIEKIDEAKQAAIAAAQFPVEGLAFNADGIVSFGGLPFDQASSAEQLRVSVAIGMALNPKLRVLLVRDGSLLDADSLEMLSKLVDAADYQLWLERVEDGGATVVIEDGSVVGAGSEVTP